MRSATRERELKFVAPPHVSVSEAVAASGIRADAIEPDLNLKAAYYDTADLRLARAGVTLRHRRGEENGASWTVKLPDGDEGVRNEVTFSGSATRVPVEASNLVIAFSRGRELSRVATITTKRRRWAVRNGKGQELAEVVDDAVVASEGSRITERFREIEVEARTPNGQGLKRIAKVLGKNGAERLPSVPKVVRVLGERAAAPPDVPSPPLVIPRSRASEAARAVLALGVQDLIASDPAVRLDEPEGVHDMRIAVRRLRSHLRMFETLLDPWPASIAEELRWLADELGRVRDLEVLVARIADEAREMQVDVAPVFDALNTRRQARRLNLQESLITDRYTGFLDSLFDYVRRPSFSDLASEQSRWLLPRLAGETYKSLGSAVKELNGGPTDEQYHEVRIQAKRTRYACEAVSLYLAKQPKAQAAKLARRAEDVQNILGVRQDCVLIRQVLLEATAGRPTDGAFNLAMGRLVERQHSLISKCEARFEKAWTELDRKKYREWLSG